MTHKLPPITKKEPVIAREPLAMRDNPNWTFKEIGVLWSKESPPRDADEVVESLLAAFLLAQIEVTWPRSDRVVNDHGETIEFRGYKHGRLLENPETKAQANVIIPIWTATKHTPQEPITREEWREALPGLPGLGEAIDGLSFDGLADIPLRHFDDPERPGAFRRIYIDPLQISANTLWQLCEMKGWVLPEFLCSLEIKALVETAIAETAANAAKDRHRREERARGDHEGQARLEHEAAEKKAKKKRDLRAADIEPAIVEALTLRANDEAPGPADNTASVPTEDPPPEDAVMGRPTYETNIVAVYEHLRDTEEIDFQAPKRKIFSLVRAEVRRRLGDKKTDNRGLGDEAIRKWTSPLFDADKAKKTTAR